MTNTITIKAINSEIHFYKDGIEQELKPIGSVVEPPIVVDPPVVIVPPPTIIPSNLIGIVNINTFGITSIDSQIVGFEFADTYTSSITIKNEGAKRFYVINCDQVGDITYQNILTNGQPTVFKIESVGIYLLKVDGGKYILEKAQSIITDEILSAYDLSQCEIFIPSGTYIHYQVHGINTLFYFKRSQPLKTFGTDGTVLIGVSDNTTNLAYIDSKLENLTLYNIIPSTGAAEIDRSYYLKNVNLNYKDTTRDGSYILMVQSEKSNLYADNLNIDAQNNIYAGIWVENSKNVSIKNSSVKSKGASHAIRINNFVGSCVIDDNYVNNANTGILIATQRKRLLKNVSIKRNIVEGCFEESISIDAFGNNTSLVPVIAKSYIAKSSEWTVNGWRVGTIVDLENLYFVEYVPEIGGYKSVILDASIATNPKEYLLLVDSGEKKYTNSLIEDFEVIDFNGKSTLRLYLSANLTLDPKSEISLLTGAYNCEISNNLVRGANPASGQPGHGVSLWGGGYYCKLKDNVIDGCKQGISVTGFGSFGVNDPDFFNYAIGNEISGNTTSNCISAFELKNLYGKRFGFANKVTNNSFLGGSIKVDTQEELIMTNNLMSKCSVSVENVTGIKDNNIE